MLHTFQLAVSTGIRTYGFECEKLGVSKVADVTADGIPLSEIALLPSRVDSFVGFSCDVLSSWSLTGSTSGFATCIYISAVEIS